MTNALDPVPGASAVYRQAPPGSQREMILFEADY
jgi:hypothetical protein